MAGLDLTVIGYCTVSSVIIPAGRYVWLTYPRVGPILAAMRPSRSWEEGLWRAS